ncbi:MAG: hypothetical protein ACOH2V_01010 [Candidatus Saccharimonadaceae bacterium]
MKDLINTYLNKVTYEFSQEGNTDGTTKGINPENYEDLTIEVIGTIGCIGEHGGYYVIKSQSGWSVNGPEEMNTILNYIKERTDVKETKE